MMDEEKILLVWKQAIPIPGHEPSEWRRDLLGNKIQFAAYGDRNSEFGWGIDDAPFHWKYLEQWKRSGI